MTHIFLTGEIQIGKSTVLNKTLALLHGTYRGKKPPYGGFRTYFGPDRASPDRCLYIGEAAAPPCYDEAHAAARFRRYFPPEVLTERFDTLGVSCLRAARRNAGLIVMDECGSLEREAYKFQAEILDILEGGTPVLGVVKLSATGWVDALRRHPNVTLLTVDGTNRDKLPFALHEMLK